MPGVGVALALVVDLLVPAALLFVFSHRNLRQRASDRGELIFWIALALYAAWLAYWASVAAGQVLEYEGIPVIAAAFLARPMSLVPTILNSTVMHFFFSQAEWAEFGYPIVMYIFLAGLTLWAILLPVVFRRLLGWNRPLFRAAPNE
jgi:hypothetical protein